ncbi:Hypothetical ATP-binding protein [gamma proteobacterium IMCC2047]|nr:Hypothetical ATP-binding protein [gamma proteobacterium IMCC2047]
MKLVIISGRSGSGKSTALHLLEDLGYYCIDNMPSGLLPALIEEMQREGTQRDAIAISIDARNVPTSLERFPDTIAAIQSTGIDYTIAYLDADDQTILTRFSATRRKHPLSNASVSLEEAIWKESLLLSSIGSMADLKIDTSNLSLHQLRDIIKKQLAENNDTTLALLFESFGFKRGVPADADLIFDVRCLPNPYWDPALRQYNGRDPQIIKFLEGQLIVEEMFTDLCSYLDKWLPRFDANNRSYMTVAIGCTGGHHRSVYLSERLAKHFTDKLPNVQVRHRDLDE